MEGNWLPHDEVIESPMSVDRHSVDFFQVVPPTPRPTHPQRSMSAFEPRTNPTHPSQLDPHLRPSQSQMYLRTHRSNSSITSMDSHTSFQSGLTGWSTVTTTSNGTNDTFSSESEEVTPSIHRSMSFSSAGVDIEMEDGRGGGAVTAGRGDGGGLSIDPKLFQKPSSVTPEWNQVDEDAEGEISVFDLPTAIPPSKKSTSRKSKTPTSADKSGEKKKISHARKQHPEHIPRPRNAFILFRKYVVDSKLIPPSVEMRHQNVSIITAKMWSEASPEQKAHFNDLAKIEKEEHAKKYPGYRYQPVYRRTNVIRRRVRKDEAEEEKCKSVAELLLKGKSGRALESEIKDKIMLSNPPDTVSRSSAKQEKASSRRSSAACELSKGALRALRAKARQEGSTDYSDISRSNSVDYDAPSQSHLNHQMQTRFNTNPHTRTSMDVNSIDSNSGIVDMEEDSDDSPVGVQYFGETHGQPVQGFYGDGSWNYPLAGWQASRQDGFGYQMHSGQQVYVDNHQTELDGQHTQQYSYPQPQIAPQQNQEYYKYDTALPFSPNLETTFAFPSNPNQLANNNTTPTRHYQPRADVLFGSFHSGLDNPSPITATYLGSHIGSTSHSHTQTPMSARWDRAHHLLPPSSEVPLDALPFDDGDLLLQDFEHALSHASGDVEFGSGSW